MRIAELQAQLRESEERNAESRRELTARCAEQQTLRAEYEALRIKHETLCAEQEAQRGGEKTLAGEAMFSQEAFNRLASELAAARHDYAALADASQVLMRQRDALQERVAELEAAHKRLVDMVWGRRSERRKDRGDPPLRIRDCGATRRRRQVGPGAVGDRGGLQV